MAFAVPLRVNTGDVLLFRCGGVVVCVRVCVCMGASARANWTPSNNSQTSNAARVTKLFTWSKWNHAAMIVHVKVASPCMLASLHTCACVCMDVHVTFVVVPVEMECGIAIS